MPKSWDLQTPATAALLYWHKSSDKLTAFILKPGESSPKAVVADVAKLDEWIGKWDKQYEDYGKKGKSWDVGKADHSWRKEMGKRLAELARILRICEILGEIHPIPRVGRMGHLILIPHRELHRLPLHALFRGYWCTYLPSLQMGFNCSSPSVGNPSSSGILSIEHPNHAGLQSLYAAEMESYVLQQMFAGEEESQYLATEAATRDAVMQALPQPRRYLHFNGHASHDQNPANSMLYLSDRDTLTVADIRRLDLRGYELAVLSGCETGLTNLETVETEYVGLASAFVKAGVRQVVSTLWTVQSDASALLMLYFYRKVRQGCPPSLALVKAMDWLRGLTDAKLTRLIQPLYRRLSGEDKLAEWLSGQLENMQAEKMHCRKFDDPYFWAAFVVTDVGSDS